MGAAVQHHHPVGGQPLHDQIVFAVTKAVITGQLRPGDRFPSVQTLSQERKINANTAMKVIATGDERTPGGVRHQHPAPHVPVRPH